MLNISIPEPCHEDWGIMTPTGKGAFCAACAKEVMDFSNMSDDEVKNYFLRNAGKNTCGRFRKSQLKGLNIVVDEQVIYTSIALWKKFLAVVVICFGMFFASCTSGRTKETPLTEIKVISSAAIEMPNKVIADTIKKDSLWFTYSNIFYVGTPMTMGLTFMEYVPDEQEHIQDSIPVELAIGRELLKDTVATSMEKEQPKDTLTKVVDSCTNPVFL